MASAFDIVTFDVPSPDNAARFWCEALRLEVVEREDDGRWLCLASADGQRRIGLQRGAARPSGAHLDLRCAPHEFDEEVTRLQMLGATLVGPARHEAYGSIANLLDPDGYAFDLCSYP